MQNTNMFLHHRYCMHLPFYIIFIQLLSKFAAQSFGVAAGGTPDAPYQTLQFTPNVTHRTDLCDRQLSMRLGELEFPNILRGANISVALGYFPDTGSVIYDEEIGDFDVSYPGYYVVILDELARRAGFSWRKSYGLIFPPRVNDSFRLQPNATVADLLLWSVNAYDISFSEWDRSIDRMKLGVNFPPGFTDTSLILIGNKSMEDKSSFKLLSYMQPFNWYVWAAIVVTVFVTGMIYRVLHKIYYIERAHPNDSHHVPGINIFYSAMAVTGQVNFSPVTHGERILVFSLCFWSLIVVSTYTANLASVLIAKRQPSYPASSLAEAERKGVPICVTKDLANAGKIKRDYPKTNLVEVDGITMTYEFLQEGKCDLVADGFSTFDRVKRNQTINPDCSLEWIGRVEYVSSGGPACVVDAGFLCTSLVGHVIEYYMKEMEYDGFLDSAFENFLDSISNHQCLDLDDSGDEEESSRLTLVDMGGIFVTHGIACVLALLVSFFQRWWDNRHQQDQEQDAKTSEKNSEEGNSMLARQIGSGDFEMEPVPESHITFTVK